MNGIKHQEVIIVVGVLLATVCSADKQLPSAAAFAQRGGSAPAPVAGSRLPSAAQFAPKAPAQQTQKYELKQKSAEQKTLPFRGRILAIVPTSQVQTERANLAAQARQGGRPLAPQAAVVPKRPLAFGAWPSGFGSFGGSFLPGFFPGGLGSLWNTSASTSYIGGTAPNNGGLAPITVGGATYGSPLLNCGSFSYAVASTDANQYGCCGANLYYFPTGLCNNQNSGTFSSNWNTGGLGTGTIGTGGTAFAQPAGSTPINCNGLTYYVQTAYAGNYGCCENQLYDYAYTTCQPGQNTGFFTAAPGGGGGGTATQATTVPANGGGTFLSPDTSCPKGYICCGSDFPPTANELGILQCCPGLGPYSPFDSTCTVASSG